MARKHARDQTPRVRGDRQDGTIGAMPAIPESTKVSLQQRLSEHARTHWPQLAGVKVRYRGTFAYVSGQLNDGEVLPLCRLRYGGSAARWGFAVYLPAGTAMRIPCCPPAASLAPPRMPWTAPAACISTALTSDQQRRGSPQASVRHHPRRTSGQDQ